MKCPRCGNDLKEGTKFCAKCGGKIEGFAAAAAPSVSATQTAPPAAAPRFAPSPQVAGLFGLNKYLFNQKYFKIRETFQVFDENGHELLYIQRLFLTLKRHIYIYTDSSLNNKILSILQDNVLMFLYMKFTLTDSQGQVIAKIRRRNLISALRRTWDILSPDDVVIGQAIEDSWFKALFRRFVPMGEFFKTDFDITIGGRKVGKYIRRWTLLDKYVLDLSEDPQQTLDRRIAIALGFLLDAGERR